MLARFSVSGNKSQNTTRINYNNVVFALIHDICLANDKALTMSNVTIKNDTAIERNYR